MLYVHKVCICIYIYEYICVYIYIERERKRRSQMTIAHGTEPAHEFLCRLFNDAISISGFQCQHTSLRQQKLKENFSKHSKGAALEIHIFVPTFL
jgi:hypothetical protein